MLLAQTETAINVFDRYGIAVGMLLLFIFATAYIGRRLLNEKNGLLTTYISKAASTMDSLSETSKVQAETTVKMGTLLEDSSQRLQQIEETQKNLEVMHYDPHSRFATVALCRCFLNGCDVLEVISSKLEIGEKTDPLLKIMRKELQEHERATQKLS